MKRGLGLISLALALPMVAAWLQERPAPPTVEVTKEDFTKLDRIRSTQLATFGVRLGDSLAEAQASVRSAGFRLEQHYSWWGFWDSRGKQVGSLVADDGRITKLVWTDGMARYLAGDAAKLFDPTIVDPESPLRLRLLGREDSRTVEVNSIGRTIVCSYDKEGIRIIRSLSRYGDAAPIVHLVQPAKAR